MLRVILWTAGHVFSLQNNRKDIQKFCLLFLLCTSELAISEHHPLTWAAVATPASSRPYSLFLHLVGKRRRNSHSMPMTQCIFRSITILETSLGASMRLNQIGIRNCHMLCSSLTDIAAFCVTGQVPLRLFPPMQGVYNTDLSPDRVENELAEVNWNGNMLVIDALNLY